MVCCLRHQLHEVGFGELLQTLWVVQQKGLSREQGKTPGISPSKMGNLSNHTFLILFWGCFEFIFMSEIDLLLFPNSACWPSWLLLPCFFDLQCGSNPCLWLLVPGLVLKPSWTSHIFDCLDQPMFWFIWPPLNDCWDFYRIIVLVNQDFGWFWYHFFIFFRIHHRFCLVFTTISSFCAISPHSVAATPGSPSVVDFKGGTGLSHDGHQAAKAFGDLLRSELRTRKRCNQMWIFTEPTIIGIYIYIFMYMYIYGN